MIVSKNEHLKMLIETMNNLDPKKVNIERDAEIIDEVIKTLDYLGHLEKLEKKEEVSLVFQNLNEII